MSADPNIDLAVMESRMAAARPSSCASAVSHRGRREVVARERQCDRAKTIPSNDDEKQASDPLSDLLKRRAKKGKPDDAT